MMKIKFTFILALISCQLQSIQILDHLEESSIIVKLSLTAGAMYLTNLICHSINPAISPLCKINNDLVQNLNQKNYKKSSKESFIIKRIKKEVESNPNLWAIGNDEIKTINRYISDAMKIEKLDLPVEEFIDLNAHTMCEKIINIKDHEGFKRFNKNLGFPIKEVNIINESFESPKISTNKLNKFLKLIIMFNDIAYYKCYLVSWKDVLNPLHVNKMYTISDIFAKFSSILIIALGYYILKNNDFKIDFHNIDLNIDFHHLNIYYYLFCSNLGLKIFESIWDNI